MSALQKFDPQPTRLKDLTNHELEGIQSELLSLELAVEGDKFVLRPNWDEGREIGLPGQSIPVGTVGDMINGAYLLGIATGKVLNGRDILRLLSGRSL